MEKFYRMKIAVIGAGAAGCFFSIEAKRRHPDASITVFESLPRPMVKLALTGGGRCNITNSFEGLKSLREAYPRGFNLMKRALAEFGPDDVLNWFRREGVVFVLQDDGCWFPESQDAGQIVRTLEGLMCRLGVTLRCGCAVRAVVRKPSGFLLKGKDFDFEADKVVVTAGGKPGSSGLSFLDGLGLETVAPVPSLFTFNVLDSQLRELAGIVVSNAVLSIPGSSYSAGGILLLTHWGLSGPAALKLSSYAARFLHDCGYEAPLCVNWMGIPQQDSRVLLEEFVAVRPGRLVLNEHPEGISSRLWAMLAARAGVGPSQRWREVGAKQLNRLVSVLCNSEMRISGRYPYRQEFVTCGGVSLSELVYPSLEAKTVPGLYFAGEVADVDAVTGGFNLQAAWSMAWLVSRAV